MARWHHKLIMRKKTGYRVIPLAESRTTDSDVPRLIPGLQLYGAKHVADSTCCRRVTIVPLDRRRTLYKVQQSVYDFSCHLALIITLVHIPFFLFCFAILLAQFFSLHHHPAGSVVFTSPLVSIMETFI